MAEFLNSYIDSVEPSMDFESKATYTSSFDDLTSLIITIGGALSIIIGIIGIANFVNSVLTSVITRKRICHAAKHWHDRETVKAYALL